MNVNFLEPHSPYHGPNKKRMLFIIFLCVCASGVFAGTAWAGTKFFESKDAAQANLQPEQIQPIETNSFWGKIKSLLVSTNRPLVGVDQDRINVALYGIGGDGHDGAQLTDTILVASIKPSTKQVAMLSIPRDTQVDIPGYGPHKINEVNADGEQENPGSGGEAATKFLEGFLQQPIPYYVRVDFSGFSQVIDDIGGVDVYVEKPFTDDSFPTNDYKYRSISFKKGWEHMDGPRALDYARSRHGNNFEGSDFARAKRQQKIMLAVRDKLLSGDTLLHPGRIISILNALDTHVLTNLKTQDFISFATLAKDLDVQNVTSVVLSDDPASVLYDDMSTGVFYLKPKDPTLAPIREIAANMFDKAATEKVDGIMSLTPVTAPVVLTGSNIEIENGTWRPGFAAREQSQLITKGFAVKTVGNADTRPLARTQIIDVTHKNDTVIAALKKRYDADVLTTTSSTPAANIDIILILGENAKDIAP